ncbi:replication initiation protein [Microvirga makkahensis]|uniref:RepB family plasmid replication initiator protein n=1 Tax=Microvirga makkahensis TaxID=1128670 RepID=A0A7X3MNS3_9HYPH|nr:replication initiation protein [Microvirga makkahensis]MXQ10449.1 RepB family plasmid replication initiator protein [Microvirga makkahensis]
MPVIDNGAQVIIVKSKARSYAPGVQAENLLNALRSKEEMDRQNPRHPKPRTMIEKVQIVGKDDLTATDAALYELFIAWARDEDHKRARGRERAEKASASKAERKRDDLDFPRDASVVGGTGDGAVTDIYAIPYDAVRAYANLHGAVDTPEQLLSCLNRLSRTTVRYNVRDETFRNRGVVNLLNSGLKTNEATGKTVVEFSLPPYVHGLLSKPGSWGYLELRAFGRFRNKYTGRLYQRLALIAGYDNHVRKPLEIEPRKLAEEIGFKWTRYVDFKRNCLNPALEEIEKWVERFLVDFKEEKGAASGRGRPGVALLRFTMTPRGDRKIVELSAPSMTWSDANAAKAGDKVLTPDQLPSAGAVARALKHIRFPHALTGADLSEFWRAAVDEVLEGFTPSHAPAPGMVDVHGERLLASIEMDGADQAFFAWAEASALTGRFFRRTEDLSIPRDICHLMHPKSLEPTEGETPDQRRLRYAKDTAATIVWGLAGLLKRRMPGERTVLPEDVIDTYCDIDTLPWSLVSEHLPDKGAMLRRALTMMLKTRIERHPKTGRNRAVPAMGIERRRATLRNLVSATRKENWSAVHRIACAVVHAPGDNCPF